MIVDWTTVGQPPLTLTLEQEPSGNYIVLDQTDGETVYMRSPDLEMVCRFMRAMAMKRHAVLDEDSVSWFRALGSHSRRAALDGAEATPAWDDGNSAPSNVVPIRMHEQLDETA